MNCLPVWVCGGHVLCVETFYLFYEPDAGDTVIVF